MKKLVKLAAILAFIGILAAIYVWFFVYNKPHTDYEAASPDYIISARDCYLSFSGQQIFNEKQGAGNFTGKVLQLTGEASKIESIDSLTVIIFVYDNGVFGDEGIRCTLLPKYADAANQINFPAEITIKGFCAGYNDTDVILQYCSIIN
jgi:ubiquitin